MQVRLALLCDVSKELIKQWLQSKRSYEHGLKLFRQLSKDQARVAFFAKGESALRRSMLIEAMVKLEEELNIPVDPVLEADKLASKVISADAEFDRFPSTVRDKVSEVKDLYKRGAALKAQLLLVSVKRDRAIMANTIRDYDEKATKLLEQIDYFRKNGTELPDADDSLNMEGMTGTELLRMKSHLEQKRSRAKKDPLKSAEVADLTIKLELVRKKIDEDAI